jgi:hypothetical protein
LDEKTKEIVERLRQQGWRAAPQEIAEAVDRLSERVGELETDRDFGRTVSAGLLEQLTTASRMSSPITLDHSAAADVWGEVVRSRSELFHLRRALSKQGEGS